MSTSTTVAEYFLWLAQRHGDYLTNLKLQKLLYYAQAWHIAVFQEPLFDDKIEAWVHGPVVARVYGKFKKFGWQPISVNIAEKPVVKKPDLLEEIFEKYGRFSALDLERMTHEEAPWRDARAGLQPDAASKKVISEDAMKAYFGSKIRMTRG